MIFNKLAHISQHKSSVSRNISHKSSIRITFFLQSMHFLQRYLINIITSIMRNSQQAFIPETISAILHASQPNQPINITNQIIQLHHESTDQFVEELKQNIEDQQKQKRSDHPEQQSAFSKKNISQNHYVGSAIENDHSRPRQEEKISPLLEQLPQTPEMLKLDPIAQQLNSNSHSIYSQASKIKNGGEKDHLQVGLRAELDEQNRLKEGHSYTINIHNKSSVVTPENQEYQMHSQSIKQHTSFEIPKIDELEKIQNQSIPQINRNEIEQIKQDQSNHEQIKQYYEPSVLRTIQKNRDLAESSQKSDKSEQFNFNNQYNRLEDASIDQIKQQVPFRFNAQSKQPREEIEQINFFQVTPTPKRRKSRDQELVMQIADHLQKFNELQEKQTPKKSFKLPHPISIPNTKVVQSETKMAEGYETDYSDNVRDIKILQHRLKSNLEYLRQQTREMKAIYKNMILDEQKREISKQIAQLEIQNRREKIGLRTASYTKRYNYICPIPRNNDKPIEFKSRFQLAQQVVQKYQNLVLEIDQQKQLIFRQDQQIQLLTKYYNHAKKQRILDNKQQPIQYTYDSQMEHYSIKPTSKRLISAEIKEIQSVLKDYEFNIGAKKMVLNNERVPYYNILKYKAQISKDMILEYEVYNLGRIKRLRDENKLVKKELEFINKQIQSFDAHFSEEIKQYELLSKPKITYQTFKSLEQKTLYTKSPYSRDYFGNANGQNNINIYRKDHEYISPLKKIRKSVSQKKYSLNRINQTKFNQSKKTIDSSLPAATFNQIKPQNTQAPSPKMGRFTDDYGLYGSIQGGKQPASIKDSPIKQPAQKPIKLLLQSYGGKQLVALKKRNFVRSNDRVIKTETSLQNNNQEAFLKTFRKAKVEDQKERRNLVRSPKLNNNKASEAQEALVRKKVQTFKAK